VRAGEPEPQGGHEGGAAGDHAALACAAVEKGERLAKGNGLGQLERRKPHWRQRPGSAGARLTSESAPLSRAVAPACRVTSDAASTAPTIFV
jgi:hypothetical protein